jgi:hypothetical protein
MPGCCISAEVSGVRQDWMDAYHKEHIVCRLSLIILIAPFGIAILLGCGVPKGSNAPQNSQTTSVGTDDAPCNNMERNISDEQKATLATAIGKQTGASQVEVRQSFKSGAWSFIGIRAHDADEAYLFYPENPLTTRYVGEWSGAARIDEEAPITNWTLENVPGVPPQLAKCFAWYVITGRNQEPSK